MDTMKVWTNSFTEEEYKEILKNALYSAEWLSCSIHEWTWTDERSAEMAYALTQEYSRAEKLKKENEALVALVENMIEDNNLVMRYVEKLKQIKEGE